MPLASPCSLIGPNDTIRSVRSPDLQAILKLVEQSLMILLRQHEESPWTCLAIPLQLALLCVVYPGAIEPVHAQPGVAEPLTLRGVHRDGSSVELTLKSDGTLPNDVRLSAFASLRNENPRVTDQAPVQVVSLTNGDCFPLKLDDQPSLLRVSNSVVHLSGFLAGQQIQVPCGAVRDMGPPRGFRVLINESTSMGNDFWKLIDTGWVRRLNLHAEDLLCEIRLHRKPEITRTLMFAFGASQGLQLRLASDRVEVRCIGSTKASITPAQLSSGTRIIRLSCLNGFSLSVNNQIVARSNETIDELHEVRLQSEVRGDGKTPLPVSFRVFQRVEVPRRSFHMPNVFAIRTFGGDFIFADSVKLDSKGNVQLRTRFGAASVGYNDVAQIEFPRSRIPVTSVVGDVCRIQLASGVGRFGARALFSLTGSIRLTDGGVALRHPVVGRRETKGEPPDIKLPWHMVRQIEPLFGGTLMPLDMGPVHLGRRVRDTFRCVAPDGTSHRISFQLGEIPAGRAFLTLLASDLLPASPETLSASRYLKEVRDGFRAAHVEINGQPLGSLNRHTQWLVESPKRIPLRIHIPSGSLRTGENVIEFRLRPARNSVRVFDDCELSNMALLFEVGEELSASP